MTSENATISSYSSDVSTSNMNFASSAIRRCMLRLSSPESESVMKSNLLAAKVSRTSFLPRSDRSPSQLYQTPCIRRSWKVRFPPHLFRRSAALMQQFGLRVKSADTLHFPQLEVHVPSLNVLSKIRKAPFVDYIEPAHIDIISFSGCGPEALTQPVITVAASNGGATHCRP
jgi:hypothetical protein